MHRCYYCPEEFPTMWVFRNHIDEHHRKGDHNRPCSCGKQAHMGCYECPDDPQVRARRLREFTKRG
jgi:hypothetical protein